MNAAFVLIATLAGTGSAGKVEIPITMDFDTRAQCVAQLDAQLQAARRALRGPLTVTLIAHCERLEVRK